MALRDDSMISVDTITVPERLPATSIQHLPTELLTKIFHCVFVGQDYALSQSIEAPYATKETIDLYFLQGTDTSSTARYSSRTHLIGGGAFFPYSLSAVCAHWKAILSAHPHFWTRIVLFIDRLSSTTIKEAADYLSYRQNLLFDVCIIGRKQDGHDIFLPHPNEKDLINSFVEILQPHLKFCRSLVINPYFSSSLPPIAKTITGNPFCIGQIVFESVGGRDEEVDGTRIPDKETSYISMISATLLELLVIDGRNFAWNVLNSLQWRYQLFSTLQYLVIANYHFPSNINLLDLVRYIASFHHLTSLRLEKISIKDGIDLESDHPDIETPDLEEVFLDSLESSLVLNISHHINMLGIQRLSLRACNLMDGVVTAATTLYVSKNSYPTKLSEFVFHWDGEQLIVDDNDNSDQFFSDLGVDHTPQLTDETDNDGFPCPDLAGLVMATDICLKSSVPALKSMVEKRGHYIDYTDPNWRTNTNFGPALRMLTIKSQRESLNEEDLEWFNQRVPEFSWLLSASP